MSNDFASVVIDALEETRLKFERYWKEPDAHRDAVNFALGLFTGIVLRRLKGDPDPEREPES